MFDGSSVPRGLRERRGEAGPRGGHLVSLNKSNGCRCDRPTSRSPSQRDCGASAPVSPRAASGAEWGVGVGGTVMFAQLLDGETHH